MYFVNLLCIMFLVLLIPSWQKEGFVEVMCYCTACCMQEWQESPLCPSPAAADLSKDIPASCILLMSPLHQPAFALVLIHFEMCVSHVPVTVNTLVWLVKGSVVLARKLHVSVFLHLFFDSTLFWFEHFWLWFTSFTPFKKIKINKALSLLYLPFSSPFVF